MKAVLLFFIILNISLILCQSSSSVKVSPSTTSRVYDIACKSKYTPFINGTCMFPDDCTGGTLSDGCSNKNFVCCIKDPRMPVKYKENSVAKSSVFLNIFGDTPRNRALYPLFSKSIDQSKMFECHHVAAFIAQIQSETKNLKFFEESSDNTRKFDFDKNLGNNATGDGTKYRGRGALYLRGKANYAGIAKIIKDEFQYDLYNEPEYATLPTVAFRIASWIWSENSYLIIKNGPAQKGNLNHLADGSFHNFTLLTNSLTVNLNELKKRADLYEKAVDALKCKRIKRGRGINCEVDNDPMGGFTVPICLLDFQRPYCGCEGEFKIDSCPYGVSNKQCRSSSIIKCCKEKCNVQMDLVILMDSSGSIGSNDFEKEKSFVKSLLERIDIGPNKTRVGIINFGDDINVVTDFTTDLPKDEFLQLVEDIDYLAQNTNTQGALKKANNELLQEKNGMRPSKEGIPKVVIVITDGQSNVEPKRTIPNAREIKKRGINIVSVGVGQKVDMDELKGMASNEDDVYNVDAYALIFEIIESLTKTACEKPAVANFEEPIEAVVPKNSYRYFKVDLAENNNNTTEFSVGLQSLQGETKLFYSFDTETPKDDVDFIKDKKDESFGNFIETGTDNDTTSANRIRKRNVEQNSANDINVDEKYYLVKRPANKSVLFMSVKGYEETNEFLVYVYNRTISNGPSIHNSFKICNIILATVFSILISLIL